MQFLASHLRRNKSHYFSIIALFFVVFAAYQNAINNQFVWDDNAIVVNNPLIRDFENIPAFFSTEDVLSPNDSTGYYRPLSRMSYLVDYQFWGLDPRGYHLTNVALHAFCAAALYLLAALLFDGKTAFITGLLFALHPINVESVAWITGRNNVLAGLLIILSFIFYVFFDRERSPGKRGLYFFFSLFVFLLALFSKEFALLLPALILLYHLCFSPITGPGMEKKIKASFLRLAPYGVLIVLFLLVRAGVVHASMGSGLATGLPQRLALSLKIFFTYLQVLLFPVALKATYFIPNQEPLFNVRGVVSVAVMSAAAVLAFIVYRRSRRTFFAPAFLFLFLVPVSNIIAFSPVPVQERYAYLASMGFCLFMSQALIYAGPRRSIPAYALLSLILIGYGYQTLSRNRDWKDDLSISLKTVEAMPDSPIAHDYLGNAYMRRNLPKQAIAEFEASARLNPGYPHAHYNLGVLYQRANMPDEAAREYQATLRLMPENGDARFNLALIYYDKGRLDDALRELKETVRRHPDDVEARNNLAYLYRKKGMAADAEREAAVAGQLREKGGR